MDSLLFIRLFCVFWTRTGVSCLAGSREAQETKTYDTYDMNEEKAQGEWGSLPVNSGSDTLIGSAHVLSKQKQRIAFLEGWASCFNDYTIFFYICSMLPFRTLKIMAIPKGQTDCSKSFAILHS